MYTGAHSSLPVCARMCMCMSVLVMFLVSHTYFWDVDHVGLCVLLDMRAMPRRTLIGGSQSASTRAAGCLTTRWSAWSRGARNCAPPCSPRSARRHRRQGVTWRNRRRPSPSPPGPQQAINQPGSLSPPERPHLAAAALVDRGLSARTRRHGIAFGVLKVSALSTHFFGSERIRLHFTEEPFALFGMHRKQTRQSEQLQVTSVVCSLLSVCGFPFAVTVVRTLEVAPLIIQSLHTVAGSVTVST